MIKPNENNLKHLEPIKDKPVKWTCLNDYLEKKTNTQAVTHWCNRVVSSLRSVLRLSDVTSFEQIVEQVKDGTFDPQSPSLFKLRHVPPYKLDQH